jgi:hypothetical protein
MSAVLVTPRSSPTPPARVHFRFPVFVHDPVDRCERGQTERVGILVTNNGPIGATAAQLALALPAQTKLAHAVTDGAPAEVEQSLHDESALVS